MGRSCSDLPLPANQMNKAFGKRQHMDVIERWRLASDSADRFSRFRRRRPLFVGLVTALVATVSLAVFASVAGLDIRQFWIAALVSIMTTMLIGCCFTLLSNHKAKSLYVAQYCRLNKITPIASEKLCPFDSRTRLSSLHTYRVRWLPSFM
jgi:hypothetical protein